MISEQDSAEWIYNLEEALGNENKTQEQTDLLQELLQKFDIFNDFKEIQKQLHPIPEQVNEYVYQTKQKKQDEQIKLELQDLLLKVSKYLKLKKFGKNEVLIEPKGSKMRDMYFIFQGSISEYILPQKLQQKQKNQEEDATLEMQKQQQKLLQELKAHEEKQRQQEEVRRQSSIQLFQQKLQSVSENDENQEEITSQHNDSQMIQQNPSDYQNYANNQNEQNNQRSVWTRKSKIFRESTFQKKMQIHARKKSLIRGKKIIDQLKLKQVRTYKKYDQIGTFEAMFKESKENYFIADQYTIVGVLKQEKLYLISEIMNYWADNIFKYLSNYFPKASKEQIQKLLNNSYTIKAIKDQTIYRQGQPLNNNFFLNLKGELSYFFEKKKLDQNFDEEDQTQLRLKKRILENIQYKQIKIIPEGEIFGETEIIQREKQRIGTVKQKSAIGEIMVFKIDLINDFFLMDVRVKLDLKKKVKAKLNIVQDQQEKIQINNEKYSNYIEESRKTIKKFNESKNYLINNKKPQVHQEYQKTLEKDPKYTKKMENEICSEKYKTGYHRVHQKEDLKELKNVQKQLRSQKKKQMEEILYMEFPSQSSANKNTYLVIPTSSQISNDDSIDQKSRNKIQTSQNLQENPSYQNIQNQDIQSLQKFNQIQQNQQSSQNLSLNEINLKQLQMSQSILKNINKTQQKMGTLQNKVTTQQQQNQMLIEENQTPVNEKNEINNSVVNDQIFSSEQLSEIEINKQNQKKINEQRKTQESKKISILCIEESQNTSRDQKDIKKKSQIYQQQTQTLPYINPASIKSIKKNSYPYFRLQNVNQKDSMSKKNKLLEVQKNLQYSNLYTDANANSFFLTKKIDIVNELFANSDKKQQKNRAFNSLINSEPNIDFKSQKNLNNDNLRQKTCQYINNSQSMKQSKTKRERQNSNIASLVSKNHSSHIFPSLQQSPNRFLKQDDYYNNISDNNNQNITINNNQNTTNNNNNQNITNNDNQVLYPKPRQKQFYSSLNLSQSQIQNSYKDRGSAVRNLDVQQETRKQIQRASQLSIQMKLQGEEKKVIEPEIDSQVKEQISRARNNDPDIINSLIKSYRNNQYNQTLDLIKKEACQQQNLKKGSKQMELQNFNIQKLGIKQFSDKYVQNYRLKEKMRKQKEQELLQIGQQQQKQFQKKQNKSINRKEEQKQSQYQELNTNNQNSESNKIKNIQENNTQELKNSSYYSKQSQKTEQLQQCNTLGEIPELISKSQSATSIKNLNRSSTTINSNFQNNINYIQSKSKSRFSNINPYQLIPKEQEEDNFNSQNNIMIV